MMSRFLLKIFSSSFLLILVTLIIKIPVFLSKHLQEDSFITWRVARNLLQYGVIGFNGDERISASTTHLYMGISAIFQMIFGGNFIYPVLVFSSILFAIGSIWIGKILFSHDVLKRGFFVILFNMTPPALTASCLGMEYGILFFLDAGLIYYGLFKDRRWAFVLFPILLVWTRIDAVIFLGVIFLADLVIRRKINFIFMLGGILGLVSVLAFNFFYFGEFVNHTITAKKLAYKNLTPNHEPRYFFYQWAYYGGLIKKHAWWTLAIFLAFLGFLAYAFSRILSGNAKISFRIKVILVAVVVFALLKMAIFSVMKAYFDWYYWLPRLFLFIPVLYYFLNIFRWRKRLWIPSVFLAFFGLYIFQLWQSFTIGYMEEKQRVQIAKDLKAENSGMNRSIILEPAGIIPFYTGLYTYDEVGLVNKRINDEMVKDEKFWWMNSVRDFKPDYILTISKKPGGLYYHMKPEDLKYFDANYRLVKTYPISEVHRNAPEILSWIYKIRPIGKDYFLYKKL
ncbi:hypothetical protein ACM44_07735 [Chryseobacterium koreense CCUG 49689]|uniref:Glycosyltransferase RgtA/B/C/D-like domain-containing protein n=2 Tax=Chryseobacterium koreense TaxID=232216 RepID=A0A0J7LQF0_9FLAO|nr:hypothetical protein ACM44_07735 [Chryseobacterium koreense CCUG 49689]